MRGTHSRWGVDLRDVTADRRLAELALRIPDAARFGRSRPGAGAARGLNYQPDLERLYRIVVPKAIVMAGWAWRVAGET